jgi:hypothetical protein
VRRALIFALAAVALLGGCGNERTPRPDIGQIVDPGTFRDVKYAELGISIKAPNRWRLFGGDAPQVATIASGDAQIAIWRYQRAEPLPVDRAQLKAARQALVAQVEGRDKTFELTSSRIVIKPGLRGVELIGQGTNEGERRSVRSLHAYKDGYEVVVDAFAPPRDFARVDKGTFGPVSRSLRLRSPKS